MKKEKDGETDFIQLCECVCVCHFYTVFESLPVFFGCCCIILHPAKKPSRTLQRTGYTALRGTRSLTKTTTPATHVTVNMILASCVTLQFTCKHCTCLL